MAAATTGSQQAAPPAPTPKPNVAPACPRATLDPKLLMAARRGKREALKDLLQHKDDEGSAAASTTTSVAPAPSTQPPVVVQVNPRRPHADAVDAAPAPLPPPTVPVIEGEQVVKQPSPDDDDDGVTTEGDSLLHVVAACGDTQNFLDCVDVIVRNKEKKGGKRRDLLEARNYKDDTPLHCAARAGNARMIGCLVGLLTDAAAAGHKETTFLGMKNKCGETALHQAVRAGSKAIIDELLKVDPELVDAGACSPFFLAVSLWGEHDDMDIARHLFDKTSPSIRSNLSYYCSGPAGGRNVLHAAVSRASVKTVVLLSQLLTSAGPPAGRLLLSQLASQGDTENGSTPLHLAASLDGLPSSLLVSPPLVLPPPRGTTSLWPLVGTDPAAILTFTEEVAGQFLGGRRYWQILPLMLSLVLKANEDMAYQPDKAGMYPIHVAAGSGSLHAVKVLLERCPDCATLRDAKGRTLLHVAAEEGRFFVVNYVCSQSQLKLSRRRARRPGAAEAARLAGLLSSILNAQDMNGDTPLHRAVLAAQLDIVRRLVGNQQVRLDVPNNVGMRPVDVSWTTMPREAYYAWDSRIMIRRSLLQVGAPYGENNRGDLFRKRCVKQKCVQDEEEKKMSENLTAAAQVLALFSVLITTVTFASAFTLPGGSRSAGDGGVAGTPVLGGPQRSYAFDAFILADTLAFGLSLLATCILLYAGVPAGSLDNRFHLLNFAYGLMWQSGRSLLAAFGLGLFIVLLPVAPSIAITVAVLMILVAPWIIKESEGLNSLGSIPMTGIGRSRQMSPRLVLGWIIFVFNRFWSYLLIFGIPAIRRWPRFTLSPY